MIGSDPRYQIGASEQHGPTKVLTEQADLAFGEAEEARPCGSSMLRHSSDGLAVDHVAIR